MSVDSETKRRSALGMLVMALAIAPVPDGAVAAVDREHIVGIYAGIAPAAPVVATTAIHKLSTSPVAPNHAADSGNNLLIAGDIEVQGDGWFAGTINLLTIQGTATGNITIGDATTLDALDADPIHNIAIGNGAGSGITDGDNNIFIGYRAGYSHTTSASCIAIGYEANYNGTIIGGITAIGYQAAKYLSGGNGNTCIGYQAGLGDFGGSVYVYNTFIGEAAGLRCNDGGRNVCLGKNSGGHLFDGDRNVFLGFDAGHTQTDNSELLIIDNRERANAAAEITDCLIYGVFDATVANQTLRFNAAVRVGVGANYTSFASDGTQTFFGTAGLNYGGMFLHSGGVTIDCPIGGAFVKITGLSSVGLLNNVTYNASALRVGNVGVYKVSWSCDADAAAANKDFEFAVHLNGTEVQQGSSHSHSAPTAHDEFAIASSCLIDVTSTAHDIDLRVRNITDDTDIDILDVSFNITQIGGT